MKKRTPPARRKVVIRPNVKTIGSHPKLGKYKNKILIDKKLPAKFRKGVALHERVEAKDQEKNGNKYTTAHRKANEAEKAKYGKKYYKQEQHAVLSIYDKKLAAARKRRKSAKKR
jgi:hypothetical protein